MIANVVYSGGYLLSAIFICLEYLRLGLFYRDKHVVLMVSFWIKALFVVIELGLAIAFGVLDKVSRRQNSAAIVEWGAFPSSQKKSCLD